VCCSRHQQVKTQNLRGNREAGRGNGAMRHEPPEIEIYAMNQKVGNQNTMI
jgi:hypothetical protein